MPPRHVRRSSPWASLLLVVVVGGAGACDAPDAATPDAATPDAAPYPPGATDVDLEYDGPRRFRVYVPPTLAGVPRALVVVLHGGGGEGLMTSEPGEHPLAVFRDVADREGFVVAWPEGSIAQDGRFGWTDCRADNLNASNADDAGFLRAVIARLRADYGLPATRVFMAGTSNGGQMTMAFAALATDDVAAIAAGSANLPESPLPGACTAGPSRPVPALFTHGSADPAMPYAGGCVANLGGACTRGRVIGAEATRDAYLALNGLTAAPTTETIDVDPDDAGVATRFVYDGAAPVTWWRLDGAGHPPPSTTVLVDTTAVTGVQNRDVEFAELAWAFFAARLP